MNRHDPPDPSPGFSPSGETPDRDEAAVANTTEPARSLPAHPTEVQDAPIGDASSTVMSDFWDAVKRLPGYIRLATALARDERVPRRVKGTLLVGGAYAISPIDLVPGVIPVAGQLDDVYVMLTALRQALRMCPPELVDEHLERSGVRREDIDADLAAVRALVRTAVTRSVAYGGRAIARLSKRATAFASQQMKRGDSTRDEKPL